MNVNQPLTKKLLIIGIGVIILGSSLFFIIKGISNKNGKPNDEDLEPNYTIKISILKNAGIMLETNNTRIYIDPVRLSDNYSDYSADIIFLTHNHGDHYEKKSINLIRTNDTQIVSPQSCTNINSDYSTFQVEPGSNYSIGECNFSVIKAYTPENDFHSVSMGFCGYILQLENYTLFIGGDSGNIPEYQDIDCTIDVAFLNIANNMYTLYIPDAIDVVSTLNPSLVFPIHEFYREGDLTDFITGCGEHNPNTLIIQEKVYYLS